MKVLILCAGRGSRLGEVTNFFPKAMVPINHKPVLGHILDHLYEGCSFKHEPEVSIAIGYKGNVIKDYVESFYPDKCVSFVHVDKFEGISTGPGYSLLQMRDFVDNESFLLVLGDTLCFDDLAKIISDENFVCVSKVEESSRFTTCKLDREDYIVEFFDKVVNSSSKSAIIGVYYIKDSSLYFEGLEKTRDSLIDNELQISNGLNYLLKEGKKIKALHTTWKDTGIEETLMSTRAELGDFNLSDSNNEITIIQSGKVRKYISDSIYNDYKRYYTAIKKITAGFFFDEVSFENRKYPKCLDFKGYSEYRPLKAIISSSCDITDSEYVLNKVLKEVYDNLYSTISVKANIKDLENEYITEVAQGLNHDSILKEYIASDSFILNGVEVTSPAKLLSGLDITFLTPDSYVPIHGNLCLENIFYDPQTYKVNLVNSKMWFGQSFIYGDLAYDLASLMKSLGGKYNNIRLNNFTLGIYDANNFVFDLERNPYLDSLKEKYCELIMKLFDNKDLMKRVNVLESILFFKNAIGVNDPREKLAHFFVGIHLLNKVANCEFIEK